MGEEDAASRVVVNRGKNTPDISFWGNKCQREYRLWPFEIEFIRYMHWKIERRDALLLKEK